MIAILGDREIILPYKALDFKMHFLIFGVFQSNRKMKIHMILPLRRRNQNIKNLGFSRSLCALFAYN